MIKIAIANQKGGVGKSTIATNLAVAFEKDGAKVAIFDLDQQGSSYSWSEERGESGTLGVMAIQGIALARELDRLGKAGCDVAIIDTRGASDADARKAVAAANIVLVPVQPSKVDLMAIGQTLDMTDAAGKPTFIFLNRCKPNVKGADEAEEAILAAGGKLAGLRVYERVAFQRAFGAGQGVMEYEPRDDAAVSEIHHLYTFTCQNVGVLA